ncbi:uncharacterized protein N7469_006781 [Penicillium citrinum]|uniref:Protein kinase domain-containing protein n=1 Tax=Penicillium citrinum TaxID=5077 RepID=A0A9W9TMQ2_PENCI|nr:uncharacterized protein N7469_006781 [Penicillium citrinum]KAJ5226775.1 hypothetical protein N7469_006781 [Penicillium citrinum]
MIDGVIPETVEYEDLLPSALEDSERKAKAAAARTFKVEPGDTLKDGRYRPFRKLGQGSYASVWLARDMEESRYVAIKVGRMSSSSILSNEISSMKLLQEGQVPGHPGKDHVVELLDQFIHERPNGSHICLVTNPLGRSLETALTFDCGKAGQEPAPYAFSRRASIQTLQALDYLHQHGIMHGDVHPGNLLLALTHDIDKDTETEIEAKNQRGNELNLSDEPYWLDEGIYIPESDPTNANVILVDLGASNHPADVPSRKYAYPIPYRAPEVVMDTGNVTCKADIWALGCVIFRIITDIPLFAPEDCCWGMNETEREQMVMFIDRLGPVPEYLRSACKDLDLNLTSDGILVDPLPEDERAEPLAKFFMEYKPEDMGEEEITAFIEFLGLMIRFDPDERSSAQDLLQHRWITDFSVCS